MNRTAIVRASGTNTERTLIIIESFNFKPMQSKIEIRLKLGLQTKSQAQTQPLSMKVKQEGTSTSYVCLMSP